MKRTLSLPTVLASVILAPSVAAQEVSAGQAVEESIVQLNATGRWATTYVDPADDPRNASATANPSSP